MPATASADPWLSETTDVRGGVNNQEVLASWQEYVASIRVLRHSFPEQQGSSHNSNRSQIRSRSALSDETACSPSLAAQFARMRGPTSRLPGENRTEYPLQQLAPNRLPQQ